MRELIQIIALLAGGYLLLRYLTDKAEASRGSMPPGEAAGEQPQQPADTSTPGLVLAEAQRRKILPTDGLLTFDEWNWVYQQVRGVPGPAIEDAFPGQDRAKRMTLAEWWAGVSKVL